MRAFVVNVVGLSMVLPALVLLQQPRGPFSILWDTVGLTIGLVGTLLVIVGFVLAAWRVIRGA